MTKNLINDIDVALEKYPHMHFKTRELLSRVKKELQQNPNRCGIPNAECTHGACTCVDK